MSSPTPSLKPSALDRTQSLRKPMSTAGLMKDTTITAAVGTSAGNNIARGAGERASKQRPVTMTQGPSTIKGALAAPGMVSRTIATSNIGTAISGSGIKRTASVTGTRSGTTSSNIKPPSSGGLNRLASARLKQEGRKVENAGERTGAEVGTGISSGSGNRVVSGAAMALQPSRTSTTATKSTKLSTTSLRQPLRNRAPTISATDVTARTTPLSPPTTTPPSLSGSFGMTRPTTSSSAGSLATITSPRVTGASGSSFKIDTGVGQRGRGHARTQSATISSPKPTTPKPVPRSTAVSGISGTAFSKTAVGKDIGVSGVGSGSGPPKNASKGVPPPSTPGKSRPQSLISANALRRSPATAKPEIATTGGTPKAVTGTGLRSSPAHKRQNSASSVSTTSTATTTGTKTRTAASTTTTQTRRLAASRRPLSLQAPEAAIANTVKLAPKISSSTRPLSTATTTITKSPPLRQPTTAPSAATIRNVLKLKPKPHIPEPLASSISSHAAQQQQQQQQQQQKPRHNFDTYQQHYTSAQIPLLPKPLTSTFLAPPTPSKQPANIALSAEVSRLQTELLQSHLLHREAKRVKEEWEEDARGKLQGMWERVRAEERTEGVVEGLLAMAGFGGTLDETKLQALDEVISGVWAMSDLSSPSSSSGVTIGKYTRVVREFEVWAGRAGRILEERRRSAADNEDGRDGVLMLDANGEVEMIGNMDLEWKNECVALGRRLEKWRRMLGELGGVSSKANYGSSFRSSRPIKGVEAIEREAHKGEEGEDDESPLARTLSRFGSLMDNMLAELQIMAQIEREAVAEEMEWVRRLNRVDDEKEGEEIVGKRATAIWRVI
ncbi:uncharacterized protein B0T23DRAFT_403534 [Neurospora hispaniola]|uniref:Uncharacterized protein n=1 Tax=Neurospora hispaniola TaxID=588809 RepID=A0AAJ0I9W8_9PEZI|nr:hypothetical protein B0T23DRAFT_403534 [Neurospora hispaniola]